MGKTNILSSILNLLKVKHTDTYTDKYFNEHPYKHNLLGLSRMLMHYGVQSQGIKIKQKENILLLEVPFIAHMRNHFIAVEKKQMKILVIYGMKRDLLFLYKNLWIFGLG